MDNHEDVIMMPDAERSLEDAKRSSRESLRAEVERLNKIFYPTGKPQSSAWLDRYSLEIEISDRR
jgi:hypothetical protein